MRVLYILIGLVVIGVMLSGCAAAPYGGRDNACACASVLYGDLSKPADRRVYALSDGRRCSGDYYAG